MKLRLVLLGLCLFLLSMTAFAQETVEWGNLGLVVEVPDGWSYDDSGENALLVLYNDDDLAIYFYEPSAADDAEDLIDQIMDSEDNTDFEFDDPFETEIMGEEAFRVDYESPGFSGFSLAFEYEGDILLLDAGIFDDSLSSSQEAELQEIIDTLQPSEGGNNNSNSGGGDTIESAADEDASAEDIVDELIELELVSEDGEFIFEEDELEEGSFELAESYEGGKIVMGGWLSMELAEDEEDLRFCTFVVQSTTDDAEAEEGTMFIAGFHSLDAVLFYEYDVEDSDNSVYEYFEHNTDIEDENQFLLIVQDDEASAYVNGEPVAEGWELDVTAGDDERFMGFVIGEGCTMNNVWAYTFE